jgi:hypothetical protein
MKALWLMFLRNLSNIMSLVGILLSVYFGVYYVPEWLADAEKQKLINAQVQIEQSVKELIYSDSACTYQEVQSLIKAKEIALEREYPFSVEQILITVESSFMDDKFLPLVTRRALIAESQSIRKAIPPHTMVKQEENTYLDFLSWASIALTILAAVGGFTGLYLRFIREKEAQEEISNHVIQAESEVYIQNTVSSFENAIIEELHTFPGVEMLERFQGRDHGFDIGFEYGGKYIYVEVKYLTRSMVGLATIQKFFANQIGLEGEFWLVCNASLTKMSTNRFNEMQEKLNGNRASKLVQVNSATEFREKLTTLLS